MSTGKILVVDDDPDIAFATRLFLENAVMKLSKHVTVLMHCNSFVAKLLI